MRIINDWGDITLRQFNRLVELQKEPDTTNKIIEYLYDVPNAEALPLTQYMAYVNGLNKFIADPVSKAKVSRSATYTVNGRCYALDINLAALTTAQYMDFTNYQKQGDVAGMVSTVLIPEGHKYNDGYAIDEAKEDILDLPVTACFGIFNFFRRSSAALLKTTLRFLSRKARKAMTAEQRQALKNKIQDLEHLLVSYPLS